MARKKHQKGESKPVVGIIGAGMMGTHMGEILSGHYQPGFYDINPVQSKRAIAEVRRGAIIFETAEELVRASDLIIFAIPENLVPAEIERLAPYARPRSCITDVAASKTAPMQAMAKYVPENVNYFGMHPNYRATTGAKGQEVILCPGRPKHGGRHECRVVDAFRRKGAGIVGMTPETADLYANPNQNLVHDAIFGYLAVLQQLHEEGRLDMETLRATATPLSRRFLESAARVLGGKAHVYGNIQLRDGSIETLERLIAALQRQREMLVGDGQKPKEQVLRDWDGFYVSLCRLLGEDFVQRASATLDPAYESLGGMQLYFTEGDGWPDTTEMRSFLKQLSVKGIRPYIDFLQCANTSTGNAGKIRKRYAVARQTGFTPRKRGAITAHSSLFFYENEGLYPGKKGIEFSPYPALDPEELRELRGVELGRAVQERLAKWERINSHYKMVQLSRRFDDPVLAFYDTVREKPDLMAMGPWVVINTGKGY